MGSRIFFIGSILISQGLLYAQSPSPCLKRSVVYARNGMACTSDPRASQAAVEILRAGGNAIDAAIAANAVLGVVEPMSCGIGGDLFSIIWDSKSSSLHGLNASGRSPKNLSLDELEKRGLKQLPMDGPLSWSLPGCVAGWRDLHSRFGKLPIEKILAPAIDLAENGFAVGPVIAGYWQSAEAALKKSPDAASTYLLKKGDDRVAPVPGDVFQNRNLAKTYRALVSKGWNHFYFGDIADRMVAFSQANGGYFSRSDFTSHANEWVQPVSTNYRGYDVWELPPNGQGIAVLQMLNVLEQHDLQSWGWGSAAHLHLLIEAKKLAYADRARFYADPKFVSVPTRELISKEYAKRQTSRMDPDRAAVDVPPGDPLLRLGDTIYLCVVDKDRNCCSLIQSNFSGFGSDLVPGDLGFVWQNRGALFALDEDHPNVFAPGKRPFHTIIPAMVTQEGQPYFVFGVMGGDMQPQGHVQILCNIIDFNMDIQAAGDAPRIRHDGSATPTGLPMTSNGGKVHIEPGIPQSTIDTLEQKGHSIGGTTKDVGGGYQGILIDAARGVLAGATESRKDGIALGLD